MLKTLFWNTQEHRLRALWRILLQFLLLFIMMIGGTILIGSVYSLIVLISQRGMPLDTTALIEQANQSIGLNALTGVITLCATLISVALLGAFVDRRRLSDFGFHLNWGWLLDFGFGLGLGALLMAGIFCIEWLAGWIRPAMSITLAPRYILNIGAQLLLFLCVGIYEETISRGYQLRNLAEGLNWPRIAPRIALILAWTLTSVVFGLGHAGNPNATFISTLNIMLAGLFLGLGYVLTGELAIPIGLHITWNLFQGTVFGFPVSGGTWGASLIRIQQGGPDLWTGGAFGPEAGIIGIFAMVIGSALTLLWVRLRWKKVRWETSLTHYVSRATKTKPTAPGFQFHEPGPLLDADLELILLEKYPGNPAINYVPAYRFKMTLTGQTQAIGTIELRVGNPPHLVMYGGHIGYGVHPDYRGQHYAARACQLLFPLAQQHRLTELWITCNPANLASRKTCELAGAEFVEIVDLPESSAMYQEGERQKCRYRITL